MAAPLLDGKGRNKEELEAFEVAEDSRESDWEKPSLVAELFMGRLRTEMVLPYPEQPEEDRKVGDAFLLRLEKFFQEHVNPGEIDQSGEIPSEVMKGLADLGAFGMKIPKEYGGLGLSQVNYNRALAQVCGHCASIAATLSAHQSIGVPQPLMLFGTEWQKKKYLPRLAKGAVSAFALTEPEVGSDPARMSTTATPSEDGSYYILNGIKLWCTNGANADLLVVMAQTPPLLHKGREKKQITAFIVEKGMPGFEVLHRCRFMGLGGIQNALLKFDQVKVPKENIIWGLGKGLRLALITLNAGRLSLPATCIGAARQCLQISREWSNERKQWGSAIGYHEASSEKIASMAANLFAMESVTWMSGAWVDRKSHDIRLEAAMAKVFCSEVTYGIVDDALQLRGGRGYEKESSLKARGEKPYPLERALRDCRINMIVEGTSEILRLFIAREALDKHLNVAGDVLNSHLNFGKRALAAVKAVCFYAVWYPFQWLAPLLSWMYWPKFSHLGKLSHHLRFATRSSHQLARTIFHLMLVHGPKLEKRQLQLSRIVNIATDLFVMAAVVGRAHAQSKGSNSAHVLDVADLFCFQARDRIRENFRDIRKNRDHLLRQTNRKVLNSEMIWLEAEAVFRK
jgi:alkylation response protein AidB-like acyl-CoA dehydrogenase